MKRALLLLSNSTNHGCAYLDHCKPTIESFFKKHSVTKLLFIPYALHNYDWYAEKVRKALESYGIVVESIHNAKDPKVAIKEAQAVYVGGGNTFQLLKTLYEKDIVQLLRQRVLDDGMPYMGASAGTNVATVNICTTNDMPIVYPPSFAAFNLLPFNINPHYIDTDPKSQHMGETREDRINEYHEIENTPPVLGLREGSWLEIENEQITLRGKPTARLFSRNNTPKEYESGSDLSFLLN